MSKTEQMVVDLFKKYRDTDMRVKVIHDISDWTNLSESRVVRILVKYGYMKD